VTNLSFEVRNMLTKLYKVCQLLDQVHQLFWIFEVGPELACGRIDEP